MVLAALIGQAFAAMYILDVPPMIFGGEVMDSMEQQADGVAQFYSGELLMQAQENVKQMMDAIRKSFRRHGGCRIFIPVGVYDAGKRFLPARHKGYPGMPSLERWNCPFLSGLYVLAFAMQHHE